MKKKEDILNPIHSLHTTLDSTDILLHASFSIENAYTLTQPGYKEKLKKKKRKKNEHNAMVLNTNCVFKEDNKGTRVGSRWV